MHLPEIAQERPWPHSLSQLYPLGLPELHQAVAAAREDEAVYTFFCRALVSDDVVEDVAFFLEALCGHLQRNVTLLERGPLVALEVEEGFPNISCRAGGVRL